VPADFALAVLAIVVQEMAQACGRRGQGQGRALVMRIGTRGGWRSSVIMFARISLFFSLPEHHQVRSSRAPPMPASHVPLSSETNWSASSTTIKQPESAMCRSVVLHALAVQGVTARRRRPIPAARTCGDAHGDRSTRIADADAQEVADFHGTTATGGRRRGLFMEPARHQREHARMNERDWLGSRFSGTGRLLRSIARADHASWPMDDTREPASPSLQWRRLSGPVGSGGRGQRRGLRVVC